MNKLAIYGAGGLGREILELANIINSKVKRWESIFFIVDGEHETDLLGHRIYNYDEAKELYGLSFEVSLSIGEPSVRERIINKITNDGLDGATLIHPEVHIPETTSVGKGVVIQCGCYISCGVQIKDFALLQPHCNIGHDDVLEEGCVISGFGNLGGKVVIGRYSYVGLGASIKEETRIGSNSIIGMGSIVFNDIADGIIALGNPARPMKNNIDNKVFKK